MKSPAAFAIGSVCGVALATAFFLLSDWHTATWDQAANTVVVDYGFKRTSKPPVIAPPPDSNDQRNRSVSNPIVARGPAGRPPAPPASIASGNAAIMNFLGEPVVAAGTLDPRYTPTELDAVFRSLCETLGFKIDKLAVDSSEFPFVLHGVINSDAGADFFRRIQSELNALPGYKYGGSVTGRTRGGATYFALNMTPESAYPREQAETIRRRLMIRVQMVAAAWTDAEASSK